MDKLLLIVNLSQTLEKWNEKLDSIASEYMDSPFFGAVVVVVVFIFGYWAISYFTKKYKMYRNLYIFFLVEKIC